MKRKLEAAHTAVGEEESRETAKTNAGEIAGEEPMEDNSDEEVEEHLSGVEPIGDGDVCRALMDRYAQSSAKQHRHLCATAAAMKSILSEEGLPLTPPAYFAAAITALRDAVHADREGAAALSSFLAIVLPLVPPDSLPKAKAKDAAFVIASFLRDPSCRLSTGSLRSMVKSLGLASLRMDLDDWLAVHLPLETLLLFAVDKRPKVRRCAQSCLEMLLKNFHNSSITKKASKIVQIMHKKCIIPVKDTFSAELTDTVSKDTLSKHEQLEALHMLNVLNVILPYLSDKVKVKILSDTYKVLGFHSSWSTRHILRLLETQLEHSNQKVIHLEAENIMFALTSYISTAGKGHVDTIISASTLLKYVLKKVKDAFPSMWLTYLPPVFASLIGYLGSDSTNSKPVVDILKELISFHIHQCLFSVPTSQAGTYEMESVPEAAAIASICSVSVKLLNDCIFPTEHMLEVMSLLFLRLGRSSFFFMKEIMIRLSQFALNVNEGKHDMKHLEKCIGASIIAIGPEKLLALFPIAIDMQETNCSNSWIIPILKKYVVGASLQYFINNIVPLINSIKDACKKVKKDTVRKSLRSYFHDLWDLLPAFCRYPIDLAENFESLSMLLMVVLKDEASLQEISFEYIQMLVYSNREDNRHHVLDPQNFDMEFINFGYSKRTVSKNMKALSSRSMDFFQILKDIFLESAEKRGCIKDAIGSLAFIIPSECLRNFFCSSFKDVEQSSDIADTQSLDYHEQVENKKVGDSKEALEKHEESRSLLMELACSVVEAADTDLTNIILDYVRFSLSTTSEICQSEAYFTLSRILKEESYSSAQFNELMELLFTVKRPVDTNSLKNRFLCFNYLLVYILKNNVDDINTKAFLILNEIILTLKSKESRKLAYDTLLTVSVKLKTPHSGSPDSHLLLLFNMVMGYLSSSSPQIMSGAVSALSLLIYHDAAFCLSVPNLIPSVLILLQNKAIEVIKATLGFVKVLVSSLICGDLMSLLPEILQGILPWSSVSKNHFRSKVGIIMEILIRKCSLEAVQNLAPEKYRSFVKSIKEVMNVFSVL
ncbi:hypothetical protein KSP39_PZI008968 [Platanthera zijinensis]|uniref:Ribosomal RNA-processing protein 12-like conserved domain-containing protein n=1 Tax=Platanthera zijinensis TaxID=2320716 RepID=A0AAP0BM05_9ASPA